MAGKFLLLIRCLANIDDDEEAKSSELIAQLLMQDQLQDAEVYDNPYFRFSFTSVIRSNTRSASYNQSSAKLMEDEDDDYLPNPLLKKAKMKMELKKREEEVGPDGQPKKQRKKRVAKPKKPKTEADAKWTTGRWTAEEEENFLKALELYGRDWDKIVEYLKTRDKNAIKSHAQKYFIKLYMEGKPLPAKVQETGTGHTLSGKELDPDSGAALQYMGKKRKSTESSSKASQSDQPTTGGSVQDCGSPKGGKTPKKKKEKRQPIRESDVLDSLSQNTSAIYDPSGRTVYAKNKLRESTGLTSISHSSEPDSELTMKKCQSYVGEIGSHIATAQPFKIEVDSNVMLVCDFHAHLASIEVIGFLGGTWDPESKLLSIKEAFPCNSLTTGTGEDAINVEMDPLAELQVREKIAALGMRVVGWYHTHPIFQPDPSVRDIENQKNYQQLLRDPTTGLEPFIGLIVGPYDIRMLTEESAINWFNVKELGDGKSCPMALEHKVIYSNVDEAVEQKLMDLVKNYKSFNYRIRLEDVWRYCPPVETEKISDSSAHVAERKIVMEPLTKLEKLRRAMKFRLPKLSEEQTTNILTKIVDMLKSEWQ